APPRCRRARSPTSRRPPSPACGGPCPTSSDGVTTPPPVRYRTDGRCGETVPYLWDERTRTAIRRPDAHCRHPLVLQPRSAALIERSRFLRMSIAWLRAASRQHLALQFGLCQRTSAAANAVLIEGELRRRPQERPRRA